VKTTFVLEDGDSAKIFNEGDDIAKVFMYESGNTAKKTFICGSGDAMTKAFVCESGDTTKKAFVCEGCDMTKGMLVCGGGDVAAGGCLPTDDGIRVWGWWDNTETYVVDARLRHGGRG